MPASRFVLSSIYSFVSEINFVFVFFSNIHLIVSVGSILFLSVVGFNVTCIARAAERRGGLGGTDGRRRPTDGALDERRAPVEALRVGETLVSAVAGVAGDDAGRAPSDAARLLARGDFAEPDVALDNLRRRRPCKVRQTHLRSDTDTDTVCDFLCTSASD